MENRILFPFKYQNDNRQQYIETLQLANKSNAEVILFTCIPEEATDHEMDNVYLHLLELNGFFQTIQNEWGTNNIQLKRVIGKGDMSVNLQSYLEESDHPPMIISHPNHPKFNASVLRKLLQKLSLPQNLIVEW
jgi:hypothetical protein